MYLHDWKDGGFIDMVGDFEGIYIDAEEYYSTKSPYANVEYWIDRKQKMTDALASDKWKNMEVLLASYNYEDHSGDAFVLFKRDGKLYEVNGSHCSCYCLEDQWEPEETTIESLRHRLYKGNLGSYEYNMFSDELRQVLDSL